MGLTTQYIPHWEKPETLAGITFKSIVETAKEYVPLLRKQADLVIVSYHGGFEKDLLTGEDTEALTGENEGYELLQQVEGIDALFTGHQHRKIAETVHGVPLFNQAIVASSSVKFVLPSRKRGASGCYRSPGCFTLS